MNTKRSEDRLRVIHVKLNNKRKSKDFNIMYICSCSNGLFFILEFLIHTYNVNVSHDWLSVTIVVFLTLALQAKLYTMFLVSSEHMN